MNRYFSIFNKRLLLTALVLDILITLVITYRHAVQHDYPFFSIMATKTYAVFFIADYLIILIIFFLLAMFNSAKAR